MQFNCVQDTKGMLSVKTLLLLYFQVINPDWREIILILISGFLCFSTDHVHKLCKCQMGNTHTRHLHFWKTYCSGNLDCNWPHRDWIRWEFYFKLQIEFWAVKHLYSWRPDANLPTPNLILGRGGGLVASVIVSGSSSLGLRPGWGHLCSVLEQNT